MKTLREGKKHLWWVGRRITCQTCASVFKFEESDPEPDEVPEGHPHQPTFYEVTCPVCREKIHFRKD